MSTYRTVEVSCFDLARLLDWCEQSHVSSTDAGRISITESAWYGEAYRSVSAAFDSALSPSPRTGTRACLALQAHGRGRHV